MYTLKKIRKNEDDFENQPPAKQPYTQERRTSGGGFFQKIFKNPEETVGPVRVETEDGGYAEIRSRSNDRDGWDGRYWKKREMSVPVSPKTVKFEDEIERELAAESARQRATVSPTGLYSRPEKYRFQPIVQPPITSKSTVYPSGRMAPPPQGAATTETLDEATLDMLRMSVEPTGISFSGTARISPTADRLQKSASTSTMNKVIRTQDGGVLKLENAFTWDVDRRQNNSPDNHPRARSETRTTNQTNPDGTQSRTTETTHEESHHIAGKPVIRTTVEGQMKIEKSVGTRLETIEHSIAKAYTIRETVTHYLIRTTMGKREVIIEERPPSATMDETSTVRSGVRTSGIYRLSVYEDGQEIGRHEADIKIPDNMNKPDYLAKLSQKLLADLATLDGEEITATTRVEIERVEDVTDYVKTYLIGQALAEPEPEPAPIQLAIPTEPEKVYNYESASDALSSGGLTPNMELNSRSYVDKLEREPEATLEKKDIHLTTEGKLYEDKTRFGGFSPKIPMESDTESVESILVDRRMPRCANVYADCDLKRTEDRSENTVLIAMPLTISMTMILRIERIREKLQLQQAAYGMEREGQKFKGEAVMRKHRRFESEEEEQEEEKVKLQQAAYGLEREGQHFRDAAVMKKQKRYESEEEEEVQRVQEQAKIVQEEKEELQVIQIQETKKVEEIKVKQIEVKEATAQVDVTLFKKESYGNFDLTIETANYAQGVLVRTKAVKIETDAMGAAYDLESRGQLLKGKALIRKHRQFESESEESIQSEELEPPAAAYDFERGGQFLEGQALLRRHKKYESETSMDYEGEMRQRGGVTHVTLFKKEAEGYFDITIECPNWGPETKARLKEVPAQRYENLEFVKSIEKTGSTRIQEETKAVFKENNKWAATLNTVAQSSENVNFIMNLKKESDYQLFLAGDSSAEGYIRSPRMESTTKSITESAEENLMVMYGLEAATKNIASSEITRKEATVQKSAKQLVEYTKEEESCAVLMENRGTLAERAASGWMDTVTELRRSEEREVEETSLISTVGYEADRGEWFDEELRKCRSVYTDFGREFSETITEESAQVMSDSQLEHTIRASRAGSSHGTTIIWIPPDEGETQLPPIGFQRRSYSVEKDVLSRSMTDISQKTSIELIEGTKPIEDTSLTSRESSSETSTSVSTEIETTQLRTIVESLGKISVEDNTTQQVKKAQKPSEKVQEASQKADMRAGIREISQPAEFSETNATLVQQQLQEVTQTTTGLSFPRTEANLLLTQACKTLAAIEDITLVASASNVGATESTLVAANLEQVRRSAEEARMEMGSLLHSYEVVERDLRKDIVITESRQQEKVFKTKAPMEEALVYEQKFEVHPQEVAKVTKTSKTKISLEASKNLSIKEEAVDSEITKPATEVSASRDIGVTLSSQEKARLKEYGFETSEFGVGFQRVSKPPSLEETEAVLAEKLLLHNTIKTIATSFEQVGQNVHLAAETMREAAQRSLHIATTEKDFLKSTAAKTEEILVEMKAGAPSKTFEIKTTQKISRKDSEKAQLQETAIELGSIQQTYQYIETDLRHVLTLPEALLQQILLKVRAAAEETAQLEKQLSLSPIASSEVISKLKLTEQAARSLFVESQDVGANFAKHDREFSTAKIVGIPDVSQDQARLKEYHAETSDAGTGFARLPKPSVDQEAEILLEERIKLQQGLNLLASIFEQVEYNIQMAAEAAREVAQKEASMKTLEHGELISKAATSEVAFSESELNALRITSDVESTLKDRIRQSAQEKLRETSVEMGNVHQAYLFAETDLRQDITVPVGRSQKQKLETKASMEEKIAIESKIGVSPAGVSEITSKIKPAEEASRSLSIEKLEIHEGLTKPSVDVEISKTSSIPVSDQERAVLREYGIEASSLQAGFERISKPASYQETEISTEDQLRLQQTLDMKASTFEKVEQNIQMVSQLAKETAEKGMSIKSMEQGDFKAKAAKREEILVSTDFEAQEVGAKAEVKAPSREEIQAHHPEKTDLMRITKIEEKEEARLREVSRPEEQYFIEKPVGVPSLDHEQAKFQEFGEKIAHAQSRFERISKSVDYNESERIQQIKLQDKLTKASTEAERSIQLDSEQPKQVVLAHAEQ
uniref:VWFA domain-containing protein n=1 Tax=Acrobeloides nanus TaxID=290746 RepID=A0A914EG47_9BILA